MLKGEAVELEIGIWAMGKEYEAGEALELQVLGGLPMVEAFSPLKDASKNADNKGVHKVSFWRHIPEQGHPAFHLNPESAMRMHL